MGDKHEGNIPRLDARRDSEKLGIPAEVLIAEAMKLKSAFDNKENAVLDELKVQRNEHKEFAKSTNDKLDNLDLKVDGIKEDSIELKGRVTNLENNGPKEITAAVNEHVIDCGKTYDSKNTKRSIVPSPKKSEFTWGFVAKILALLAPIGAIILTAYLATKK